MVEVDPQFRGAAQRSKARRMRRRLWRGGAAAVAVAVAGGAWLAWQARTGGGGAGVADGVMVQVDAAAGAAAAPRVETPFVDIPGDPMILRFAADTAARSRPVAGPAALDAARLGPVRPDRLLLVEDDLIVASRELMTALPSSREDFAFFQAQRNAALQPAAPRPSQALPGGEAPRGVLVTVAADDASWGPSLAGDRTVTFVQTAVENTTSVVFIRPEAQRRQVFADVVLAVDRTRPLAEVLAERGLSARVVEAVTAAVAAVAPGAETLEPGGIVAVRSRPGADGGDDEVLHLSVYGRDGYLASVVRTGPGRYGAGPNLWIDKDLPRLARGDGGGALPPAGQEYRLLDGFYSAAIRNGVPPDLVGEAIVLMSQAHDMDAIADPKDRMTLLFAPAAQPGAAGPAQIVFAAIDGPAGRRDCYVVPDDGPAGYACFRSRGGAAGVGGGGGQLVGGLVQPAQGVMTAGFGPSFDPVLKVPKLHEGMDWAAPVGTPVVAAGAGRIARAEVSDTFGNIVFIDHGTGMETRYAHLDAFAPGIAPGVAVAQGQLIGYVGTTGLSTGPHLHFELRIGGTLVDPTTGAAGGAGGGGAAVALAAAPGSVDPAVELLVDTIINVESGGNAAAKNPLSTATGLGQFIESTWLRMMRDYRPDLAANMDRASLLALRTDPTLSREMITNLARENESYLRARGHAITAGRLYLAHFAGPAGAALVLSAPDTAMIRDVMGAGVVGANPFLASYTVADLKAWADRKMGGGGAVVAVAAAPVAIPEAVKVYMGLVDAILAEGGTLEQSPTAGDAAAPAPAPAPAPAAAEDGG